MQSTFTLTSITGNHARTDRAYRACSFKGQSTVRRIHAIQHVWCALFRELRCNSKRLRHSLALPIIFAEYRLWSRKLSKSWLKQKEHTFAMDLSKASEEEKLRICRKYFIGGFFLLPFFWLVNSMWFFREAFMKKNPNPKIRRYVGGSMIGTLVWTTVLIVWTVVFQTQRAKWLPFVDYITLTVPDGAP